MVIIKCNALLNDEQRRKLEINIHDQAADGVIVLPHFCELLNEVPADETIKVVYKQEPVTEESLKMKELYRRTKEKLCMTCRERHAPVHQSGCWICSTGELYRKE